MNNMEKIDFMRKVYSEEIEIWDEENDLNENHDKFCEMVADLCKNGHLDLIKPLLESFDDDCYEISWMHDLEDAIWIIAERYGDDGTYEVLKNLKYVRECGRYHGNTSLIIMALNSGLCDSMLKVCPRLSKDEKQYLLKVLNDEEIKNEERYQSSLKVLIDKLNN